MTKAELAVKIAEAAGITKTQAEKALKGFIDATTAALRSGEKVTLIGFGTFSAVTRKARTGRNPQTGKALKIPAKTVGKFSAGKPLKDLKAPVPKKAAPKKAAPKKAAPKKAAPKGKKK